MFVPIAAVAALAVPLKSQSGSPRLSASDVRLIGSFATPPDDAAANSGFAYTGNALTYNATNNSIFISGWHGPASQAGMAEISIPALGGRATYLQPMTAALESKIGTIGDDHGNGRNVGGQLVYNNRLYITAFVYYDSPSTAVGSLFSRPLNLGVTGQVSPVAKVGAMNPGYTSAYMTTVPQAWRSALGGPAVIGNCCLSIVSRTSAGPALFAFDPSSPAQATPLVYYDQAHQTLGAYGAAGSNPIFNGTTRVTGVVIPEGSSTALFFGSTGKGAWCYGTGPDCGDPADPGSKGDHAYPYVGFVWAYDLNALAAVKAGRKNPWDVTPYATWELGPAGNNFSTGGTAYDPATDRVYFAREMGNGVDPLIEVYQIGPGGGAPAPSTDTTAPSVSVTSPSANATVQGVVALKASASDNVGIGSVWFTVDGATTGAETTVTPYQVSWNSAGASNGTHVIRALARDAAGNTTTSAPVTVTTSNSSGSTSGGSDTTAPVVALTSPAANATVAGTMSLAASATDNVGVVSVRFSVDDVDAGGVGSAPYSMALSTGSLTNGHHVVRAIARDAAGNTTTSAAVTVFVSNGSGGVKDVTAPVAAILSPINNATITGTVTLRATASDNIAVTSVEFFVDGKSIGAGVAGSGSYSLSWATSAVSNAAHALTVVARDAAGNSVTSAPVTINVRNVLWHK